MYRKVLLLCLLLIINLYEAQYCKDVVVKDVLGNDAVNVDCNYPMTSNKDCLVLEVNVPEFYDTNSYNLSSIPYQPVIPFNSGTPLNANSDDLFLEAIELPFTFCFFGNNYNKISASTNGLITFDLSNLDGDGISFPNIQSTNPSPLLPTNSIFGVMHDMVFSADDDSEIFYTIEGDAPCRRVIINFYNGKIAGCQERSSSQIVLYEGSNNIEVFVEKKPMPCSSAKLRDSLIGILNQAGNLGYSPENRNTGVWSASTEAWKFSPSGDIITPTINWYNSNNDLVGNGKVITVCPDDNDVYTAELIYNICGTANYILKDEIVVNFSDAFPLVKDYNHVICNGDTSLLINLNDDVFKSQLARRNHSYFNFKFFNTKADAENNINAISPNNITITGGERFYTRVENPNDPSCFRVSVLSFEMITNTINNVALELCDSLNDGVVEGYQLQQFNALLFNNSGDVEISYFLSQANANSNLNEVNVVDLTPTTQLWIRAVVKGCVQVFGPIMVKFIPGPEINTPIDFEVEICDMIGDKIEEYDFHANLDALVTTDPNVVIKYYSTQSAANSGTGTEIGTIKNGLQIIYVRVEFPNGCFSVGIINLNVKFKPFEAHNPLHYICFNGSDDVAINLDDLTIDMLLEPLPPVVIKKSYFETFNDAVDGLEEKIIGANQTITEDGNYVAKKFYVRFEDEEGCFIVRDVTITLVFPKLFKNQFDVCDVNNDATEYAVLNNFSAAMIGDQPATVTYHNTTADALANINPQLTTLVNGQKTMFVRIVAFGCVQVYPITLNLVSTPMVEALLNVEEFDVCDNNNDGEEPYDLTKSESRIYPDPSSVNFKYYLNYNPDNHTFENEILNPKAFIVKGTAKVFVKTTYNSLECFSVTTLNVKLNFRPAIILKPAVLSICDINFDLHETFNLSQAISQLFIQEDNVIPFSQLEITYYKTEEDANEGDVTKAIGVSQVTEFSSVLFWARFQDKINGCYSVQSIELKTYFPPKALVTKIKVCDENLDGILDANLLEYTKDMVVVPTDENNFSFYYTRSDAENRVNAIANPERFSANPFPNRLWVRIENIPGCKDINFIDFEVNTKVQLKDNGPFVINDVCDLLNDGKEIIDLTRFENQIFNDPQATFAYYGSLLDLQNNINIIDQPAQFAYDVVTFPDAIYVMVSYPGLCPALVKINIELKKSPIFTIPDHEFCPGTEIDIRPNLSMYTISTYEWRNPNNEVISTLSTLKGVKVGGVYTLTVTATNGCMHTASVNVIEKEVPIIEQLIPNGPNAYTVIAKGSRKIIYSTDGINWQDSNVFNNLPPGVVNFYVKFENDNCIGDIKKGLSIEVYNVFSPNGDGSNDVWAFDHLDIFDGKSSQLNIVDRTGVEVFKQISTTKFEWTGQHNGRSLPTASYWYVINLADGRTITGWILLKNRN